MKIITIAILIGSVLQPKNWNTFKEKIDIKKEFGVTSSELFNYNGKSKAISQNIIYFDNGIGYFITYEKENLEKLGSILYAPSKDGWEIKACYTGSYIPFNNNQNFYVSPECFITFKEKLNTINMVSDTGITFGSIIDSNRYFPVSGSVSSHLYVYSASYLQESRILNVPNYMNTQFNHNGCSPTTAAMYFSYLEDNGLSIIDNSAYKNLPIKHTDDTNKVNAFINYLGTNYFETDKDTGTPLTIFKKAYDKYLDTTIYSNYELYSYKNYNEFKNSIDNAANPAHVSLLLNNKNYHAVLGIGYKEIHQSNGDITRFVIANAASNNAMNVNYYSANEIISFRSIHR